MSAWVVGDGCCSVEIPVLYPHTEESGRCAVIRWSAADKRFPSPASCPIDMNVGTSAVPVESPRTSDRYHCCMEQRLLGMMVRGYTVLVHDS